MTVTFGPYTFDRVDYDDRFDILRIWKSNPGPIGYDDWDTSREDYSVVWSDGGIVSIEILSPRMQLQQGKEIVVTLEDGTVLRSPDVERAITPRTAA
ncbi:MAG: hypothetical protein ACKORG_05850 [Actinomycetota bacterium]